jgi:hypothetical protein
MKWHTLILKQKKHARNILLRALVDQPHKITWQLVNVSEPSIS